jgi:predicted amidohydrolase
MTEHAQPRQPTDALDELVSELLSCGAVLSQIIAHMVRWEAAGRSAPDAAPIPTAAHSLLRGVLTDVAQRYSRRDLKIAAAIVKGAADAISEDVLLFPLDGADDSGIDRGAGEAGT